MTKTLLLMFITRALPVLLAALGGFIFANYPDLHTSFCVL